MCLYWRDHPVHANGLWNITSDVQIVFSSLTMTLYPALHFHIALLPNEKMMFQHSLLSHSLRDSNGSWYLFGGYRVLTMNLPFVPSFISQKHRFSFTYFKFVRCYIKIYHLSILTVVSFIPKQENLIGWKSIGHIKVYNKMCRLVHSLPNQ